MCIGQIVLLSVIALVEVEYNSLQLNPEYHGGQVGYLITNYYLLSTLMCIGIRQMCDFGNGMTSTERVLEYTKVDTEPIRSLKQNLSSDWVQTGKITFSNVSLKYTSSDEFALKNVNFTIDPEQRIGIVGRTGAGKSSLIAALFQMYHTEGEISIDTVNITKIPLEALRSKISIIPQQPVLFSGTLRKNLDPLEQYNDDMLWSALEQVELKSLIESYDAGLNTKVQDSGANYSVGERQLICFARAILRKNKILVIDEATANVDLHTDTVIQRTLKRVFCNCTVITIAHRLNTIMDADKVLVMDNGSVVEFDSPYNLLRLQQSTFYKLAQATGKDSYNSFLEITETVCS